MSHLSTYKSEVLKTTKRSMLEKTLGELGFALDYSKTEIVSPYTKSWTREEKAVHCVIRDLKENKILPFGLHFSVNENGTESVEVKGDFWGTGYKTNDFTNAIAQTYQKNNVLEQCQMQGWYIENADNIVKNDKGEMVIDAYRYA